MDSLRITLRSKTSQAHDSVDAALIDFDLTSADGLRDYLLVHFLARQELAAMRSGHAIEIDHSPTLADIRSDLEVLGVEAPAGLNRKPDDPLHPVGLTYVIAGSSLGSKLLYKRWSCAVEDKVKRAGRFMTRAKDNSDWIKFLGYIEETDFSAKEIDDILISANACFDIFTTAILQVTGAAECRL